MILLIRQASLPARVFTVKEKLMAMAMHDVKTPISSVKESSSLVYDGTVGELNDMQKKCMDIACKEIIRVHRIVENIARIGQFEEQALEQNIRPVSIKAVMTRAGELVKEKLTRKKIKFVSGQEFDNKITVLASEKGLNNSFYYLFDYILGKTEPSTDLSLDCEVKDRFVNIRFQYIGTIPSLEQRETIFSDFWANKETALIRKEHIDAFSLQICRFHIENVGGKIKIREIPDSGKVQFLISLPVR